MWTFKRKSAKIRGRGGKSQNLMRLMRLVLTPCENIVNKCPKESLGMKKGKLFIGLNFQPIKELIKNDFFPNNEKI